MPHTLKIFIFSWFCFYGLGAAAGPVFPNGTELLRADEMAQLSPADQQQALRIVSELATSLDKTAQGHAWLQKIEWILPTLAYATSYSGDAYQASQEALDRFQNAHDMDAGRDSLTTLLGELRRLQDAHQPIPDKLKEQFERNYNTVHASADGSELQTIDRVRSIFNRALSGGPASDPGSDTSPAPVGGGRPPSPARRQVMVLPPKPAPAVVTSSAPTSTAVVAQSTSSTSQVQGPAPVVPSAPTPSPLAASTGANTKLNDEGKRCISSGFVLSVNPRGRCNFIHSLKQTRLAEKLPFDAAKFTCSGDTVLCNPILFGFVLDSGSCPANVSKTVSKEDCWKKARPICAPNQSQSLTKICQGIASSQNLKNAVDFIQGKGAKIWDDYQHSLVSLCNSQGNSKDVVDTCKVAMDQMTILKKQVTMVNPAATANDGRR